MCSEKSANPEPYRIVTDIFISSFSLGVFGRMTTMIVHDQTKDVPSTFSLPLVEQRAELGPFFLFMRRSGIPRLHRCASDFAQEAMRSRLKNNE
jgi:hypothetical protein